MSQRVRGEEEGEGEKNLVPRSEGKAGQSPSLGEVDQEKKKRQSLAVGINTAES